MTEAENLESVSLKAMDTQITEDPSILKSVNVFGRSYPVYGDAPDLNNKRKF